jgi:hypothetical protein
MEGSELISAMVETLDPDLYRAVQRLREELIGTEVPNECLDTVATALVQLAKRATAHREAVEKLEGSLRKLADENAALVALVGDARVRSTR